ncbi:flagellar secretion chaperone FliS [Nitrosomonas stercoris]|uniref:Flagellar secretion chaperone FliS n=1 Tax=Nitrosomonas stercoris TaxID=1444684 RepID=A0A4Y1YNT0_9PROT|nr:flagellar secretion chaperone FliS [Nitrosomonas stercoris]
MFTESPTRTIKNYQNIGVESGVASADPHKLILMLLEGARQALDCSRLYIQQNKIAAKGEMLSKAITIIEHGLKASLDKSVGGELAIRLDQLYEYMSHRLLTANLNNDVAIIEEVNQLLGELQEAWVAIKKQPNQQTNVQATDKANKHTETGITV